MDWPSRERPAGAENAPSVWDRNLEALARFDRELADDLEEREPAPVEMRATRCGLPTLAYRGQFLHSPFQPDLEARTLVSGLTNPEGAPQLVVLFGLGLGYVAKDLLECTRSRVLVFEPDRSLLGACLRRADLTKLLDSPRLLITTSIPQLLEALELGLSVGVRADILALPGYRRLDATLARALERAVRVRLKIFEMQVERPAREARESHFHSLENLPWLWRGERLERTREVGNGVLVAAEEPNAELVRLLRAQGRETETWLLGSSEVWRRAGLDPSLRFPCASSPPVGRERTALSVCDPPAWFAEVETPPRLWVPLLSDIGHWANRVLFGEDPALPLGMSRRLDAILLAWNRFRSALVLTPGGEATEPQEIDALAERKFLQGVRTGFGGRLTVRRSPATGDPPATEGARLEAVRAALDTLSGGEVDRRGETVPKDDRPDLERLMEGLSQEQRLFREEAGRVEEWLRRWSYVCSALHRLAGSSAVEERRILVHGCVADIAESCGRSRLLAPLVRSLVLEVLRPPRWAGGGVAALERDRHLAEQFLAQIVSDLPRLAYLTERALLELARDLRAS